MGQSFTPWRVDQASGQGGNLNMYMGPAPQFRDDLDALRSMWRRTPDAQYPDGYLGNIQARRGDNLIAAMKGRQNERSYQRGVHKGERIDQQDYFWPSDISPTAGIKRQMRTADFETSMVARFKVKNGGEAPHMLINNGKPGAQMQTPSRGIPRVDSPGHVMQNPRAAALARLAPGWS